MSRYFVFLKLELKRALKTIPYLLAGAIMLIFLISIIAFCAGKLMGKEAISEKVKVAVVVPEGDSVSQMALSFLSTMESVESFCEFLYYEDEEALTKLKNHEVFAVLSIPDNFVKDIIDGTNTPVTVILPKQGESSVALLKELTSAGELSLSSSQAGIYAAGEYFIKNNKKELLPQVEDILNDIYVSYALSRNQFFDETTINALGAMTPVEYYTASAIVLFLLLCGIPCAFLLKKESRALQGKYRIANIRPSQIIFSKIAATALMLIVTSFVILLLGMGFIKAAGIAGDGISFYNILFLIPVILTVSAIIVFVYELMKGPVEGILFLFISSIVMLFLSGGILPIQFLPKGIRAISPFIPTTILMNQIGTVITNTSNIKLYLNTLLIGVLFYFGSIFIYRQEA